MRAAAARLREMAAAAKEATHPGNGEWRSWYVIQDTKWEPWPEPKPVLDDGPFGTGETVMQDGRHVPTGEAFVAHERYAHDAEEDWYEPEFFAGPVPEPLARFIAAMGPDLAEAIANWLDRFGDELYCYGPAEFDHALAIARAFLGAFPELAAGEGR
jgi:hypothetical protein